MPTRPVEWQAAARNRQARMRQIPLHRPAAPECPHMIPATAPRRAMQPAALADSCGARRSAIRANCCRCSAWTARCRRISDAAAAQFPLRVPRGFVARMRRGDPARSAAAPGAAAGRRDCGRCRASTLDAVGDARRARRPRRAPQIPRPRAAGRHRQLRGALPLLLPPPLSLRRGNRRGRRLARGRRSDRAPTPRSTKSSSPAAIRCRWRRPSWPN